MQEWCHDVWEPLRAFQEVGAAENKLSSYSSLKRRRRLRRWVKWEGNIELSHLPSWLAVFFCKIPDAAASIKCVLGSSHVPCCACCVVICCVVLCLVPVSKPVSLALTIGEFMDDAECPNDLKWCYLHSVESGAGALSSPMEITSSKFLGNVVNFSFYFFLLFSP